jgi:biopolymer transport protein TolQ
MIDPIRAFLATAREAQAQEAASEAAEEAVATVVRTAEVHGGGMNYWEVVTGSGPIVFGVLLLLVVSSVFSWAIIVRKSMQLRKARLSSVTFLEAFWQSKRLDAIYQTAESLPDSPVAQVFKNGYVELTKISKEGERRSDDDLESVHRAMRRSSVAELTHLESGTSYLATIGSTAPFVGLFGTVWGILMAFHEISRMGSASLDTVSGPIAEALIATAAGLAAAIPAVVAYNQFVARIRILESEMDNFSSDFLNIVKRHFFKPASAAPEKRASGS